MFKNVDWRVLLIVILVIVGLVYLIYRWGKRNAEGPQVTLTNGTQSIPKGWTPEPLARQLHDALDGVFVLAATKGEAFKKVMDLPTDDMIKSVYNAYNTLYFKEGNGTLVQWLRDELNVPLDGSRGDLVNKLVSIGCS